MKVIARELAALGPFACFYLAAAVSDFYMTWADMVSLLDCSALAAQNSSSYPDGQQTSSSNIPDALLPIISAFLGIPLCPTLGEPRARVITQRASCRGSRACTLARKVVEQL